MGKVAQAKTLNLSYHGVHKRYTFVEDEGCQDKVEQILGHTRAMAQDDVPYDDFWASAEKLIYKQLTVIPR